MSPPLPPLVETLANKKILLTGSTGFLGKVYLSALLTNYPEIGQIVALVRAADDQAARDRFVRDVVTSPAFDPLRDKYGVDLYEFVSSKVTPVQGDLCQPLGGLSGERLEAVTKDLDLVLHCAGLVEFVPPLDKALDINVQGTLHCLQIAKAAGKGRCGFIHVSTCFVCGTRDGQHQEVLDPHDYPKRTHSGFEGFDAAAEYAIARRLVDDLRAEEAKDPALQADLWEASGGSKRKLKRLVDLHVRRRLVEIGIERAQRWGWPNTYTYSKALAERLVHLAEEDLGSVATVRPAVVESSMAFPSPGWNQGINTSAPLVWMTALGQRYWPTTPEITLDVIPVDYVAHALIAISAAVIAGTNKSVYQLGTSDSNAFAMRRVIELASLAYRDRKDGTFGTYIRRTLDLDAMMVPRSLYTRWGLPGKAKLVHKIRDLVNRVPEPRRRPLRDLLHTVKTAVKTAARDLDRGAMVVEIYVPFIEAHPVTFRCDNAQRLYDSLDPLDQAKIPYLPAEINWRHYWNEIHIPGLERWAFPQLRLQQGGAPSGFEPEFSTLTALFEDRARFGSIVLWRRLDTDGKVTSRVTYEGACSRSRAGGRRLVEMGVKPHDRVAILSENSPEWGMGYFAIQFAGATCVPLEQGTEADRALALVVASGARQVFLSPACEESIGAEFRALTAEHEVNVLSLVELVAKAADKESLPELPLENELVPRAPATLLYTSGTTGASKGVLLSHEAFCKQVRALASLFQVGADDRVLSVLPLHHCFEFSAGFLLPLYGGATVTYLHEVNAENLRAGLDEVRPTAMIGVPALFEAWQRKVRRGVRAKGDRAVRAYDALLAFHRGFRKRTGLNLGRKLFGEIHDGFGGDLRLLVSGGAALSHDVSHEFEGLGIDIHEGYGLSEAGPVLATCRPDQDRVHGSVGLPIPGVELKIADPDGEGVGEILARSPSLFSGYDGDPELTARTLCEGWLRTGDLGRLDDEGYLHVVGRLKDAIVDASGNTVHPDEVEDLYADCPDVSEIAVAGVNQTGEHEVVGALVVPSGEGEGGIQGARERIREFVRVRSEQLPYPKRIKVLQFTSRSLPRTPTRKVKRAEVARILTELSRAKDTGRHRKQRVGKTSSGLDAGRIFNELAGVNPTKVVPEADLSQDLGLDSIALAEIVLALAEEAGRPAPTTLTNVNTVAQLLALFDQEAGGTAIAPLEAKARAVRIPAPVQRAVHGFLDTLQEVGYGRVLNAKILGRGNIPYHTNAIIVANHCSHLDVGLVKYSLGDYGREVISAGARDYFFKDTLRATYFENFTHVVPFDRHESVRQSLDRFVRMLRQGRKVLIFPEGTRSVTGRMAAFKPGLGLLVQASRTGILPIYLSGTHKSMPKGTWLPKNEKLEARIGPFLPPDLLIGNTSHLPRRAQANRIVEVVREALCALRDGQGFDPAQALPPHVPKPVEAPETPETESAKV
ncbi:MAG: AMP-binding protein [Planctomycetes bacterium]|nr:AMP-binding protein [Planctomycetota bacterium]